MKKRTAPSTNRRIHRELQQYRGDAGNGVDDRRPDSDREIPLFGARLDREDFSDVDDRVVRSITAAIPIARYANSLPNATVVAGSPASNVIDERETNMSSCNCQPNRHKDTLGFRRSEVTGGGWCVASSHGLTNGS